MDAEIISTIARETDVPFHEMSLDELKKDTHAPRRGYTPNELKQLLQELVQAVVPVDQTLPPEQQKQLTSDLDTLVEEATSANPRRRWYELSAEGIIEAAKAIGEIGKTALELGPKVLPLIGQAVKGSILIF